MRVRAVFILPLLSLCGVGRATADQLVFVPLPPCRVIDTRLAGGIFQPNDSRDYILRGPTRNYLTSYGGNAGGCGIPDQVGGTNVALALALNIVAADPTGQGHFRAFPAGNSVPTSSTINFSNLTPQLNIANQVILPTRQSIPSPSTNGDVTFTVRVSSAHLVVDVVGYFTKASGDVSAPFYVAANGGHWAELAGSGIGGTGNTGVTGWAEPGTGMFGYGSIVGLWGETAYTGATGVFGNAYAGGIGVHGNSGSGGSGGVFEDGNSKAYLATTGTDQIHWAGLFEGDVNITGSVFLASKAGPQKTAAIVTGPSAATGSGSRPLIATSSGAYLSSGGNWVNASDASVKENFEPLDGADVLARIAELPVQSWNYIADGPEVRHIGPTAQDFETVFSLGGGDTTISTIDPSGLALVAIQELTRRLQARDAEIAELQARLAAIENRR
jgi:hypothetical protein